MSLNNLPETWLTTKLVDVCEIILGQSPEGKSVNKDKQGIVFYQGKTEFGKLHPKPRNYCTAPKKIAERNDILLSVRAPVGPTNVANETTAIGRGLAAIRAPLDMSFSYVLYYFKYLEPWLSQQGTGTTFKAISGEFIRNLDFTVPAEAEQQEIVRQLDVMLAQVEQIKARLDAIPAILKKFRQSVLADAVSGKLTEGANCSKWIKSTIGAEFKCIDGDRGKNYPKKEDYQTEGYCLFLSTKNVRKFGFLFDDKVFISKQKHEQLRNGTLERDDLIITTRGTLGHIASYDKNVPFDVVRINSGMLILRKTKQNLLNEFMMLLLASPKFQRIIEEQRTGSAQPQLPAKILKDFEIELPSLDEQKLIVQKVESYFELIEKTEDTVQSAQKRVNLLTQSILGKAFSGELTAEWREQHQDLIRGVNSAEALLAKIQAEREASKPNKKVKKSKS